MKKIIILLMLFTSFFTLSCKTKEKRTYMSDGTYVAYNLSTTKTKLLNADGLSEYIHSLDDGEKTISVNTPVLTTIEVTVINDKIVKYNIDELQSIAKISYKRGTTEPNIDENGYVKGVTWVFNDKTKKELGYEYNLGGVNGNTYGSCSEGHVCKEWFLQISELERFWLDYPPETYTIKKDDIYTNDELIAGVTINITEYEELAKEAIKNARNGKAIAITEYEHYSYDVTYVNADVNETGKISNVKLNAQIFGNYKDGELNTDAYNPESEDYLIFGWNSKDKYSSYGEMSNGNSWQEMIDKFNKYINDNGWDSSITPARYIDGKLVNKGVTKNGEDIEILSSVTIQLNNEVIVMNKLINYFPTGFKK